MKSNEVSASTDGVETAGFPRLLGVGADPVLRDMARYAQAEGASFHRVLDSTAALRALGTGGWAGLLVQMDEDAEERLGWWVDVLARMQERPRFVVLVPGRCIGLALRASQLGAFDVLPLPVGRQRFIDLVRRIRATEREIGRPLPQATPIDVGPYQMLSASPSMLPVFRTIAQVAPSCATVLILGDSGTGKELVARAIHQHGPQRDKPFVAVNCAAIPENLLESELFGHEKGSFTGAVARKTGRFERASHGTLFLDEIGDMSLPLQSKILRAIQEREIERVGGSQPIPVNPRLIAATNQDLTALIEQKRFREDLYYRLAVVTIRLPRLAERENDLLFLTSFFLREFGQRYGKEFCGVSDRALELLTHHEWVGNVRELRNVIERAVLMSDGDVLLAEHLPDEWRNANANPLVAETVAADPLSEPLLSLREMEMRHIAHVLDRTSGHIGEAAHILGVHRNTLARKTREYGL